MIRGEFPGSRGTEEPIGVVASELLLLRCGHRRRVSAGEVSAYRIRERE
jgi:hypothetical protein